MGFTPFIETDQPTMANFNEKFLDAILEGKTQALDAGIKIATGSYTGTGTYGSSNPNSLTFDFVPKVIFLSRFWVGYYMSDITNSSGGASSKIFTEGLTTSYAKGFAPTGGEPDSARAKKSADGKTISWYNTSSAANQLNASSYRYYYIAIGQKEG